MYITYTFVYFAILLIRQLFGAVSLPVTISLAVGALNFKIGSNLGLLPGSSNLLVVLLEVPLLLPFALFLETSGLIDHQHLMLLLDCTSAAFSIAKSLGIVLFIPCIL